MKTKAIRCRSTARAAALAALLAAAPAALQPLPASAAGRVGGGLSLDRVEVRFVGGERVTVIPAGQQLRAEAEITFSGTGQLNGAWEIAEPASTAGAPQFRNLELVSRLLSLGHREVLASPPLPTAGVGAYLLRLRITAPALPAPAPLVQYFVGQPGVAPALEPPRPAGTLAASGPAARLKDVEVSFSWAAVPGSIAYQLELYPAADAKAERIAEGDEQGACLVRLPSKLDRPPVTGMLVPGTQTAVTLSQAAASKLAAGATYLWRVVALDGAGGVLCDSPLRELAW
jgi:hypothetical protein